MSGKRNWKKRMLFGERNEEEFEEEKQKKFLDELKQKKLEFNDDKRDKEDNK